MGEVSEHSLRSKDANEILQVVARNLGVKMDGYDEVMFS